MSWFRRKKSKQNYKESCFDPDTPAPDPMKDTAAFCIHKTAFRYPEAGIIQKLSYNEWRNFMLGIDSQKVDDMDHDYLVRKVHDFLPEGSTEEDENAVYYFIGISTAVLELWRATKWDQVGKTAWDNINYEE